MEKDKLKKILIIRDEHIGDYGITIPLVASIHKEFKNAKIDVVVGPWNKGLAKVTPHVNKIIIFENPLIKRNISFFEVLAIFFVNLFKFKKHFSELNKSKYDIVINFSNRKYSKILNKMISADKMVLGTNLEKIKEDESKRLERVLSNGLGMKQFKRRIKLKYTSQDIVAVKRLLTEVNPTNKKLTLIHPISPIKEKDWPIEKWIEFVKKASIKNKKYIFIIIGSPSQEEEINKLIKKANLKNLKTIAGKLTLPQLVLFIDKSNLIMGGDSGPTNLTRLTKTPMIKLFSYVSDPIEWGPPKNQGSFLQSEFIQHIELTDVLYEFNKIMSNTL